MNTATRVTLTAGLLAVAAGVEVVTAGQASALKNCGGQNAAPQPVPYTCVLPPKVIDGTTFTGVVHADGTTVVVTIHLAQPRQVDTAARIVHHEGISGAGGASDQSQGVIPAGATDITLTDSAPCRDGQLDVKVVFTGNGDARGRLGGPWIRNGTDCATSTSVPPPSTTIVSPPTTAPTSPTPPTSGPNHPLPPTSGGGETTRQTLPATGSNETPLWIPAAGALGLGCLLIAATRKRRPA